MSDEIKRRDVLRLTVAGLLVGALGRAETPLFFSTDEFAAVDELTETIIPTDSHSPGAKAAGCAEYIDRQLAESVDVDKKKEWHVGLKALEARCHTMFDKSIAQITPEQRVTLLQAVSKNEENPKTKDERFFNSLKHSTAFAYYSSSIGIHKEMEYKGNVVLPQFVGIEVT
jgi:gluconate 2-dehydrogenase gamma chain